MKRGGELVRRKQEFIWQEFRRIGKLLSGDGQIAGGSGNMSMCKFGRVWYTKSGALLGDLKFYDIVSCKLEKAFAFENVCNKRATRESIVHNAVYAHCFGLGIKAIVHTHASEAVALSFQRHEAKGGVERLKLVDAEGVYLFPEGVEIIRVKEKIGSKDLARAVARAFERQLKEYENYASFAAVIVAEHGVFAGAKNLEEAYIVASTVYKSAKLIFNGLK